MDTAAQQAQSTTRVQVRALDGGGERAREDAVAVEEPMEIRLSACNVLGQRSARSVSVTMRTPGHDFELAVGFLFTEGVIEDAAHIKAIDYCGPPPPGMTHSNIVRVDLADDRRVDLTRLQRNFFATSSCGICGKASLDALDFDGCPILDKTRPMLPAQHIHRWPDILREAQAVFDETGGLHAAGLFTPQGELLRCREDVGRHNAVDKLIGAELLAKRTPLSDRALLVSGRVSFEILQKALAAGLPIIIAVGAPSSLAVDMAERFGMTLIGFARDGRFNIYTGEQRIER